MKFIRKNFLTLLLAVFVLIGYFHDRPVLASGITPEQPLEAQWVPNAVKITFNSNGGGVAPKPQIYTYGIERSLPGIGNMIKEGYHVIGWAETADATSPKWPLGALSDDAFGYSDATQAIAKTLYAVWEEDFPPGGFDFSIKESGELSATFTEISTTIKDVYTALDDELIMLYVKGGSGQTSPKLVLKSYCTGNSIELAYCAVGSSSLGGVFNPLNTMDTYTASKVLNSIVLNTSSVRLLTYTLHLEKGDTLSLSGSSWNNGSTHILQTITLGYCKYN